MKINWKALFSVSLLLALSNSGFAVEIEKPQLLLKSCHVKGIRQQVQCGSYTTLENYAKPDGTTLNINFVVLPAIDKSQDKLPLMFLVRVIFQSFRHLKHN